MFSKKPPYGLFVFAFKSNTMHSTNFVRGWGRCVRNDGICFIWRCDGHTNTQKQPNGRVDIVTRWTKLVTVYIVSIYLFVSERFALWGFCYNSLPHASIQICYFWHLAQFKYIKQKKKNNRIKILDILSGGVDGINFCS